MIAEIAPEGVTGSAESFGGKCQRANLSLTFSVTFVILPGLGGSCSQVR